MTSKADRPRTVSSVRHPAERAVSTPPDRPRTHREPPPGPQPHPPSGFVTTTTPTGSTTRTRNLMNDRGLGRDAADARSIALGSGRIGCRAAGLRRRARAGSGKRCGGRPIGELCRSAPAAQGRLVRRLARLKLARAVSRGRRGGQRDQRRTERPTPPPISEWQLGVQRAPNHVPPDWPDGGDERTRTVNPLLAKNRLAHR